MQNMSQKSIGKRHDPPSQSRLWWRRGRIYNHSCYCSVFCRTHLIRCHYRPKTVSCRFLWQRHRMHHPLSIPSLLNSLSLSLYALCWLGLRILNYLPVHFVSISLHISMMLELSEHIRAPLLKVPSEGSTFLICCLCSSPTTRTFGPNLTEPVLLQLCLHEFS